MDSTGKWGFACRLCSHRTAHWCDRCREKLCIRCFWAHICLPTKEDYSDSVCGDSGAAATSDESENFSDDAKRALRASLHCRSHKIKDKMYLRAEPCPELSNLTLHTDLGIHCFGATIQDFRILTEAMAWDLPRGFVCFHKDLARAVVFHPGELPRPLEVASAFSYMRELGCIGLVMAQGQKGLVFVIIEVQRYAGQSTVVSEVRNLIIGRMIHAFGHMFSIWAGFNF